MSNISLDQRKNYVGASEVADLFGVGFKSRWQLWLEKAGRIESEDLSENEHIRRGNFLEPAIAAWAADKWGMKLRKVRRYIPHPFLKGFGASCDYESQEGTLIPVEIKSSEYADGWEVEGDTILDAPLRYLLQVQAQLACHGAPYGWLVVMQRGRLYRMKVDMHRETVATIEQEVAEFWLSIEENKEPKPDFAYDGAVIAELMSVDKAKVVDLMDNNHLPVLCAEYKAAVDVENDGKARKETALAEIRSIIGGAGKVLTKGFTITNSVVAETQISYLRKSYVTTRINQQKEIL
jgi:putative phage-type endonuclease